MAARKKSSAASKSTSSRKTTRSKASTTPDTMTVPTEDAMEGLASKYPSTAPTPIEEAVKLQKKADKEKPSKPTVNDRLDAIEKALGSGLNITVADFLP